jgi:hypothetical protein
MLDPYEPLMRDVILSLKKLKVEGNQEECKVMLGWELNSRILTIAPTQAKFEMWFNEIK